MSSEGPIPALSLTRATEEPEWQARYKDLLAARTADDFAPRPIQFLPVDSRRFRSAFMSSKQPRKLWRATHAKETGVIACLTHDDPDSLRTPLLLQYVLVAMHYFFEVAYASSTTGSWRNTIPKGWAARS